MKGHTMAIKFFVHTENSGFASREDLAAFVNGRCVAIWTIGVENGNTTGSLNHPFSKGQTEEQMLDFVASLNELDEDAVCLCGATEEWHTRSAACHDFSVVTEVTEDVVFDCSLRAKRRPVAMAILDFLRAEQIRFLNAAEAV